MIRRMISDGELSALPLSGIEANKIRALFLAYGLKYDFCRFFRQENAFLSALDGSFVLCGDKLDFGELAEFLSMNGFSELFCCEAAGKRLSEYLDADFRYVKLCRFEGGHSTCDFTENPPLSEVYEILREGFDIQFEPWYLDMSHRIRHGISRCFTLNGASTVTVQHELNGEALLSQTATKSSARGQGSGSALVRAVASLLSPSEVYVICEDSLLDFYRAAGFAQAGKKCIVTRG